MEDGNHGISSSSTPLVDDAAKFRNSLNELKAFSSHLYRIAYYCETAFCTPSSPSPNTKPLIVESTKEYVSRAVVTMVDHLGSISATLELGLSTTNSLLPQTQRRIHILQHRIQACQQYPQKLALARLRPNAPAHLSTLHSRYIIWKQDPTMMTSASTSASRASHCVDDANNTQGIQIQAKEPLLNYCQKDDVVHDSSIMGEQNNRGSASLTVGSFRDYKNVVPPVHDGLGIPPQVHDSKFQFQFQEQESSIVRPPKGSSSAIKSKALMLQKKGSRGRPRPREITAALIRRGKRILA